VFRVNLTLNRIGLKHCEVKVENLVGQSQNVSYRTSLLGDAPVIMPAVEGGRSSDAS
jgi:hypothetical protein